MCIIERKPVDDLGSDPCGNAVHKSWFKSEGVTPAPWDLGAVSSEVGSVDVYLDGEKWRDDLTLERRGLVIDKKKYVRGALGSAFDQKLKIRLLGARKLKGFGVEIPKNY